MYISRANIYMSILSASNLLKSFSREPHLRGRRTRGNIMAHDAGATSPDKTTLPPEVYKLFEVQKVLGKGSYGIVYRAKRFSDGKLYALKEADVAKMSAVERKDAVNEIRLMASIKHENIVRYHEAILDGPSLVIVMEYAPNGDLSRFIRKGTELKKAFPEEMIWKYIIQVCKGLQHLHANNIIHRDIKPANIFVGDHDIIKVGDLGIAKLVKDGVARTQIGTPHFMPPELWSNQPYTFSSDLWALGCCLYELMTYRVPFEAKSMAELRGKVMNGTVKPITPGKYSMDLVLLMQSLLNLTPSKRPSLDKILSSSAIQKRLGTGNSSFSSESHVIGTIKVPENLGDLVKRLPPASYEINVNADAKSAK